ncbi:MAG: carboxypeptidase regulatory-like domain-containing protein, partial [Nanoarchaeota archaeon]|nr:carboxypeptidase regulatory-like domain-containing protein [Nanoarchaeota archaeon]
MPVASSDYNNPKLFDQVPYSIDRSGELFNVENTAEAKIIPMEIGTLELSQEISLENLPSINVEPYLSKEIIVSDYIYSGVIEKEVDFNTSVNLGYNLTQSDILITAEPSEFEFDPNSISYSETEAMVLSMINSNLIINDNTKEINASESDRYNSSITIKEGPVLTVEENNTIDAEEIEEKIPEAAPENTPINPFVSLPSFLEPSAGCTIDGGWCSCLYGCSTAECCSTTCNQNTCFDIQCSPEFPSYCNSNCYSCNSGYELCCPSSGSPSYCCGSSQICQSDGSCLTPQCTSDSECPNDGYYCSAEDIMFRNFFCSGYQCYYSDSVFFDCSDNNQWVCIDSNTRAYIDYECFIDQSLHCTGTATSPQTCAYGCSGGSCITTTTVSGYQKYSNGAGVPNVRHKLVTCDTSTEVAYSYTTSTGYYSMSASAGNYQHKFSYLGYELGFSCQTFGGAITRPDIVVGASLSGKVKYTDGTPREGVIVKLKDCSNNVIDTTTTDSNGDYQVSAADAGDYKLYMEVLGVEYYILPCTTIVLDQTLSDVVLESDVGGTVKYSDEAGRSGVTVNLRKCDGTLVATDTTDSAGVYTFYGVDPGDYRVTMVLYGYEVNVFPCQTISGQVSLPNVVFDATLDGNVKFSDDTGRFGVTVNLRKCDGTLVDTTTTDMLGHYNFDIDDAGDYQMTMALYGREFDMFPCQTLFLTMNAPDIVFDSIVKGYVKYSDGSPRSGVTIRLKKCDGTVLNTFTTDAAGYYEVYMPDAGQYMITFEVLGSEFIIFPCQNFVGTYNVTDLIFDAHISGKVVDSGALGISGLPFRLTDCSGNLVATDTTNNTGDFDISVADAGYYDLYFDYAGHQLQVLDCYRIVGNVQFGNPLEMSMTLHGYLKDLSNNPLQNYDIELYDCSDNFVRSATTSATGYFSIYDDAWNYQIMIDIGGGWKIMLRDLSGNSCFFILGDADIGTLNINPTGDCSIFDYLCYGDDIKLFGCHWDSSERTCSCYGTECMYGCTNGLPECDQGQYFPVTVDINDPTGRALRNSKVFLDDVFKGYTDIQGKLVVNALPGYRNIKADCPGGTYCGAKMPYVDGPELVYITCSCMADT